MPRKFAVLKQFTQDLDRLLREAEAAFHVLRGQTTPTQAQILAVYRPIHSLKGICGMVDETKLLVRAFHLLEDALPPLLPGQTVRPRSRSSNSPEWAALAEATFRMAHEVERLLLGKIELWKKLGADENESRGLIVSFFEAGASERVWVPITSLLGMADAGEVEMEATSYIAMLGREIFPGGRVNEALIIEGVDGPVAVYCDEIETLCTRLETVQVGAPRPFKDWWASFQKRRGSSAA